MTFGLASKHTSPPRHGPADSLASPNWHPGGLAGDACDPLARECRRGPCQRPCPSLCHVLLVDVRDVLHASVEDLGRPRDLATRVPLGAPARSETPGLHELHSIAVTCNLACRSRKLGPRT